MRFGILTYRAGFAKWDLMAACPPCVLRHSEAEQLLWVEQIDHEYG